MTEENKGESQEESPSNSKKKFHFQPDSAMKMLLKEISTPRLIGIVNALCNTNYPINSTVDFGNTEHFKLLGDLGKNLVRGDFVATIQPENPDLNPEKIVLEFQSTNDKNMGFRLMVYTFNESIKDEKTETYVTAKGSIIYTTTDLPPKGNDEVNLKIGRFRVGETEYSGDDGDILTLLFPFINVLEMELEEFENSPLELLQVVHPYLYRKKPDLIKNSADFSHEVEKVREFVLKESGDDRLLLNKVLADILMDLWEVCEENNFEKEMDMMADMYKSHSDFIEEQAEARGEAKGEARGEARGKLQEKLDIAKNLIGKIPNFEIANATGIPLAQVEQLGAST